MGSQSKEENSEYAYLASVCLGMCFVSNVDLRGSGKRLTMPTMLGPVNPRTDYVAADTNSPQHSHKTPGLGSTFDHCQRCQQILLDKD